MYNFLVIIYIHDDIFCFLQIKGTVMMTSDLTVSCVFFFLSCEVEHGHRWNSIQLIFFTASMSHNFIVGFFLPVSELRVVLIGNDWSDRCFVEEVLLGASLARNKGETDRCLCTKRLVDNKNLVIVNTPDLLSDKFTSFQLLKHMNDCLRLSAPGPNVFLLVLKPQNFTEDHKQKLCRILEHFSAEAFKHSLIVIRSSREDFSEMWERFMTLSHLADLKEKCRSTFLVNQTTDTLKLLEQLELIVRANGRKSLICKAFLDSAITPPLYAGECKMTATQSIQQKAWFLNECCERRRLILNVQSVLTLYGVKSAQFEVPIEGLHQIFIFAASEKHCTDYKV